MTDLKLIPDKESFIKYPGSYYLGKVECKFYNQDGSPY